MLAAALYSFFSLLVDRIGAPPHNVNSRFVSPNAKKLAKGRESGRTRFVCIPRFVKQQTQTQTLKHTVVRFDVNGNEMKMEENVRIDGFQQLQEAFVRLLVRLTQKSAISKTSFSSRFFSVCQ